MAASLPAGSAGRDNGGVSAQEIDQYLEGLDEPKRETLAQLRQEILNVLPEAEQGISYGLPAFKVRGKTIAGFAAFKNHLSYLPHSGSVFPQLEDELKGFLPSLDGIEKEMQEIAAMLECTDAEFLPEAFRTRVQQEGGRERLQQRFLELRRLL